MNIKFISVFLLFLGAFFSKSALSETMTRNSGFYMGPSLGISQVMGEHTMISNINGIGTFGYKAGGENATVYGGVMAGYHLPLQEKNFFDFEVYYLHQNNQANLGLDNGGLIPASVDLKKKYRYGGAVLWGRTLYDGAGVMPLSAYVRLAIERGEVQAKRRYHGGQYGGLTFKSSETFTSFAPGLGLKLNVSENSFVKLGYVYVFPHTYSAYLPHVNGYYNHKFRHSEQRVELSFGYQF